MSSQQTFNLLITVLQPAFLGGHSGGGYVNDTGLELKVSILLIHCMETSPACDNGCDAL